MKKYEKPEVKFESLRLNKSIADKCWGYLGSGGSNIYYYDTTPGYVKMTLLGKSNCANGDKTSDFTFEYCGPDREKYAAKFEQQAKDGVAKEKGNFGGLFGTTETWS